jgi:hypothetical protein
MVHHSLILTLLAAMLAFPSGQSCAQEGAKPEATSAALLMVFRHERDGRVDGEMRRRMRLIIPHVRRAVLIGLVVHLQTATAATFADTLDGISAG